MTPQEIPAGEQLMGLTSEPKVDANMEFLFQGMIWPTPEEMESRSYPAAISDPGLVQQTVDWVRGVLKPELTAPDLGTRLRAARAIVSGQDAFLARYMMGGHSIQIVVTRFHVHLTIAPGGSSPLEALHQFLQVDRPGEEHPWSGPWKTGQVDQLTFGYQPRGSAADWRDTVFYVTNGWAVKFSLKKIAMRPGGSGKIKGFVAPTEEAERHWFPPAQ